MSATSVPARATRHPMTVVTKARALAAEGLTVDSIIWLLEQEGVKVGVSSVRRWTSAKYARDAKRDNARSAARKALEAGTHPLGRKEARPEFKLARMRTLREVVGLKDAQIARVMAFDFGEPINRSMVTYALKHNRFPRSLR